MTRRERVLTALRHTETDFVPYHCDLTGQEYQKMLEYTQEAEFMAQWGCHMTGYCFPGTDMPVVGKPGYFRDAMGAVWNRTGADRDIGVIDQPVIRNLEEDTYVFPPLDAAAVRDGMKQMMARREDRFAFGGIGFSLFERAWSLCGMAELLMGMLACPQQVEKLLCDICEYNLAILDIILEYDVDGVYFGDDWGQQKGLIMGPRHWRHFIKPHLARMYAKVKGAGKFVLQHSCGDISQILPDLADIGLDVYQTVQPEIYDLTQLKEEYGSVLSFWGGISTQRVLPMGTPQEVKRVTAQTLRIMGHAGGYIAGPTHAVPQDVPPENLLAMIDVLCNQAGYLL